MALSSLRSGSPDNGLPTARQQKIIIVDTCQKATRESSKSKVPKPPAARQAARRHASGAARLSTEPASWVSKGV
jgi:hypothetical protein